MSPGVDEETEKSPQTRLDGPGGGVVTRKAGRGPRSPSSHFKERKTKCFPFAPTTVSAGQGPLASTISGDRRKLPYLRASARSSRAIALVVTSEQLLVLLGLRGNRGWSTRNTEMAGHANRSLRKGSSWGREPFLRSVRRPANLHRY